MKSMKRKYKVDYKVYLINEPIREAGKKERKKVRRLRNEKKINISTVCPGSSDPT